MKKSSGIIQGNPFKERVKKRIGEFRQQNQDFMQGNYKPPVEKQPEVKQQPKQQPKKTTASLPNNTDYRKKALENQLNKYQGGE